MIPLKTPEEIRIIAEGGKITASVLQKVLVKAAPGVSTLELDKYAEELILAAGGTPSFKGEKGYGFATCTNVNDMVVHGLPSADKLQEGDILGVDLGVRYRGFHTDASWTTQIKDKRCEIKEKKTEKGERGDMEQFLKTGEEALAAAIKQCVAGQRIGNISKTIQETIEGAGYSCVKQLVGHGVGKKLHEDPEIPCYLRGRVENTPEIKTGMVLAIEVIYNEGKSAVVYQNNNGWTIVARDGLPSGLFEHTVAVTKSGPRILTKE